MSILQNARSEPDPLSQRITNEDAESKSTDLKMSLLCVSWKKIQGQNHPIDFTKVTPPVVSRVQFRGVMKMARMDNGGER